jgi:hypothetical protein
MRAPRFISAMLVCCAAVGVFACAADRATFSDQFPQQSWETASSLDDLGWSATQVAALKSDVDAHSVRKSFMSALIGMAVAEGKIDPAHTLEDLGVTEKATSSRGGEIFRGFLPR